MGMVSFHRENLIDLSKMRVYSHRFNSFIIYEDKFTFNLAMLFFTVVYFTVYLGWEIKRKTKAFA